MALFPISLVKFGAIREWQLFDTDEGRDLAAEVREYFIPGFQNWKNYDAYQTAFERLLRDLKEADGGVSWRKLRHAMAHHALCLL